jgi:hypothetical protein
MERVLTRGGLQCVATTTLALVLGELFHVAATPHVLCPVDGEWVHPSRAVSTAPLPLPAQGTWWRASLSTDALLAGADHGHCHAVLSQSSVVGRARRIEPAVTWRGDRLVSELLLGYAQGSALSRAPKQSPPV